MSPPNIATRRRFTRRAPGLMVMAAAPMVVAAARAAARGGHVPA